MSVTKCIEDLRETLKQTSYTPIHLNIYFKCTISIKTVWNYQQARVSRSPRCPKLPSKDFCNLQETLLSGQPAKPQSEIPYLPLTFFQQHYDSINLALFDILFIFSNTVQMEPYQQSSI